MSKRRPSRRKRKNQQPSFFILDQFSLEDIKRWTALRDKILSYHWEYYSSLAYQRSRITDDIRAALVEATEGPIPFTGWQRIVRYQYTNAPLSVAGSLADIGGRFNIGNIDAERFTPFPALYIASDRETAMQEALGQGLAEDRLSGLEFALTKTESITAVSVNGILDSVINLNHPEKLDRFVRLIKDFVVAGKLTQMSKESGWEPPGLIRTVPQLLDGMLYRDWRQWANLYDVPVASQIFGQLVMNAGIEGIVYPSKFNDRENLAIFPQVFTGDSHIELAGVVPAEVKVKRLDVSTAKNLP
ncbi:MAG: RES family NAD+ phosphorylase [Elusimicrobia bacterium]|nr:RES family NAD+ phosphorylase [Elusimicrobiota bacterium]